MSHYRRLRKSIKQKNKAEQFGGFSLSQAKSLLKVEIYLRALALPFAALCLFVTEALAHYFASFSIWFYVVAFTVFAGWFFYRVSLAQQRIHSLILLKATSVSWLLKFVHNRAFFKKYWTINRLLRAIKTASVRERFAIALFVFSITGLLWVNCGTPSFGNMGPMQRQQWHLSMPALHAWIVPPEYTGLPPIMLATPTESRKSDEWVSVPEGSVVTVHMLDKRKEKPILQLNGKSYSFEKDAHGDYEITQAVQKNDVIALLRGLQSLGYWHIKIVPSAPPSIKFKAPPETTVHKALKLSFEATDLYGLAHVTLLIDAVEGLGVGEGVSDASADAKHFEMPLLVSDSKKMEGVSFADLTSSPMAGQRVTLQLRAENNAGRVSYSDKVSFLMPERVFRHPIAQALIEMRKQLLVRDDERVRYDMANVMASIAHQPMAYRGDPLALMALRTGAVRLMLDPEHGAIDQVVKTLWNVAVRIEVGAAGVSRENLRLAESEMALVLNGSADDATTEKALARLQVAVDRYLEDLSHIPQKIKPKSAKGDGDVLWFRHNDEVVTPDSFKENIENLRQNLRGGAYEEARRHLVQMEVLLENIQPAPLALTEAQKSKVRQVEALKKVMRVEEKLRADIIRANRLTVNEDLRKRLAERQKNAMKSFSLVYGHLLLLPEPLKTVMRKMSETADMLLRGDLMNAEMVLEEISISLRRGALIYLHSVPSLGDAAKAP